MPETPIFRKYKQKSLSENEVYKIPFSGILDLL